ncbi:hypothetical protein [Streptomyces sp. NPDC102487]|uniref:hypothetical protein n=1 Tax=Streptomyces sp. NPDC102487 TaxID=3366182 RepID=UPI003803FDD0
MKRALATTVLLLAALTACGGSAERAQPAAGGAASRTPATQSKPSAAAGKPAHKACSSPRDVIVWSKVPGLADSSQRLGGYNLATCETTFDSLRHTSPTQAGYCTLAAWASDNPGYDTDAAPAKRPKAVQVSVGPDC